MFNSILRAAEISPADVRLLRHKDNRAKPGRTPYDFWRDEKLRPMFEDYQSIQDPRRKASLSGAKYWASFLATPDDKTLFVGLYASAYRGRGDQDRPWPQDPERVDKANEYDVYNLELQSKLGDLIGKLVIDWGPAMLSWVQYAEKNDKAVLELRTEFKEPDFPGCLHFVKRLSEIEGLPGSWIEVLRNSRGIYLLTCPTTKEQYVGKADGHEGFWQRWIEYVQTGHGGNVILQSREPSDYQVSILEEAGTVFDFDKAETLWKIKLQTRQMGLNAN